MYCPECGKQIQNGSKFCQHCGFKLSVFTDNEIKLKTKKKNNKNKDNMAVSISFSGRAYRGGFYAGKEIPLGGAVASRALIPNRSLQPEAVSGVY